MEKRSRWTDQFQQFTLQQKIVQGCWVGRIIVRRKSLCQTICDLLPGFRINGPDLDELNKRCSVQVHHIVENPLFVNRECRPALALCIVSLGVGHSESIGLVS